LDNSGYDRLCPTGNHRVLLYEYPINERIRTYLRIEHLVNRFDALVARSDAMDHHFALVTLFETIEVAGRTDLKSDLLRDIEKQKQSLIAYRGNPAIAEQALEQVIADLERCYNDLHAQNGKAGQALADNEALSAIRSRISIPAGTCEFDLPGYYAWQHGAVPERQADLQQWFSSVRPLANAADWLLKLLRQTGTAQKVMAMKGQYQQTLPQTRTVQLLRLRVDSRSAYVPEISANRLVASIRLMRRTAEEQLLACADDVSFEIALCG
jgi:cell division protein ZapD